MTKLLQRLHDELVLRQYSPITIRSCLRDPGSPVRGRIARARRRESGGPGLQQADQVRDILGHSRQVNRTRARSFALCAVGFRLCYDGQGGFSQISNVKGSITGTVPDSQGFGTYEVNSDCTGSIRFQPGPGILVEERLVIVDNGREIRAAVMVPTAVAITSVHQQIRRR